LGLHAFISIVRRKKMGSSCTKLTSIDLNNNGKSDIAELIAAGVELAVERILAEREQSRLDRESIRSVDVRIVDSSKD
jgi:hypothetical protein